MLLLQSFVVLMTGYFIAYVSYGLFLREKMPKWLCRIAASMAFGYVLLLTGKMWHQWWFAPTQKMPIMILFLPIGFLLFIYAVQTKRTAFV